MISAVVFIRDRGSRARCLVSSFSKYFTIVLMQVGLNTIWDVCRRACGVVNFVQSSLTVLTLVRVIVVLRTPLHVRNRTRRRVLQIVKQRALGTHQTRILNTVIHALLFSAGRRVHQMISSSALQAVSGRAVSDTLRHAKSVASPSRKIKTRLTLLTRRRVRSVLDALIHTVLNRAGRRVR